MSEGFRYISWGCGLQSTVLVQKIAVDIAECEIKYLSFILAKHTGLVHLSE